MIGIIDYEMGNLYSVYNAFLKVGAKAKVISSPKELKKVGLCVLPGVAAFGKTMDVLNKNGWTEVIKNFITSGKPFLGICLGLQLLFEKSEESPGKKGLGIFEGDVARFKGKIKIPQIGWNQIEVKSQKSKVKNRRCPLLKGIKDNSYFYFCHSYYIRPIDKDIIVAKTKYGGFYPSMISKGNVFGIQFHPEKSQEQGLKIIKNFVEIK